MNQVVGGPASECGNCGTKRRWLLHHVRIRGVHRRMCTACVLRHHPSSFCPSCFQFYDSASVPPLSKRLTCSKCSSFTHSHCAKSPAPNGGYLCSSCSAPALLDIDMSPGKAINKRTALVLLCAAKISASSMSKAVVVARTEAERRVREAALARKRAREAIENLAIVVGSGADRTPVLAATPLNTVMSSPAAANGYSPAAAAANSRLSGSVEVKMERMEIEKAASK